LYLIVMYLEADRERPIPLAQHIAAVLAVRAEGLATHLGHCPPEGGQKTSVGLGPQMSQTGRVEFPLRRAWFKVLHFTINKPESRL
jgi:hypothetical protein